MPPSGSSDIYIFSTMWVLPYIWWILYFIYIYIYKIETRTYEDKWHPNNFSTVLNACFSFSHMCWCFSNKDLNCSIVVERHEKHRYWVYFQVGFLRNEICGCTAHLAAVDVETAGHTCTRGRNWKWVSSCRKMVIRENCAGTGHSKHQTCLPAVVTFGYLLW